MANLKLNQVIALAKGAKSTGEGALTLAYHQIQKTPLLAGISKTYAPRDDDGEQLPSEGTKLQVRVEEVLEGVTEPLTRLLDLTATLDAGNQMATANVVVDGQTILTDVPVTTLLTLEKKLVDFNTFISKLPVLDASETWQWDPAIEAYRTEASQKTRTKKIPRNHEKAPATDKHPAQVEVYYEDKVVGDWSTTLFSGAVTETRRRELVAKVAKLQAAVKVAREQANMTEVADVKIGAAIFEFLDW
jgi:hypothetical protein